VQKPVTAASRASAATRPVSSQPATGTPARKNMLAPVRQPKPIMFAKRGGRESSSGPSPKRGWINSK
jgi:hypothetical protein